MSEIDAAGTPAPETVQVLVDNHRRFLAFLERRLESREAAEDVLQEAYVRGLRGAASLRDGESAVAWFYRLLRNAVVDHYRRRGARSRALDRLEAEIAAGEARPDDDLLAEVCRCVSDLVDTLKPEYATAIRRVDLDGVEVGAFASEQGITANNASVRLHRAREALGRRLTRSCGTCAEHGCLDCSCSPARRGRGDLGP